ncbi:MAG: hypothetical protein J2P46_19645, partial [Zavarzinella sp.]|nr:hypothetical protein [Zavarzinella sp.]
SVVASDEGDPADPSVLPPSGPEEPPPGSEAEPPPAGSASPVLPFIGDLELHVDLAGWANAAGELFDGLDAVFSPLDGESPWARLGYWALAVGAVGVTVELTRQGLRKKSPEPGAVPILPGAR